MLGPTRPILTDTALTVTVKRTGSGLRLRALRLAMSDPAAPKPQGTSRRPHGEAEAYRVPGDCTCLT